MLTVYRWIRSTVLTLAGIVGVVCIAIFLLSLLFGVKTLNVISGSMEPGIPTGSLIFSRTVDAAEITTGDVITVNRPDDRGLITHRVVGVADTEKAGVYSITMRGDANKSDDPQPYVIDRAQMYLVHVPVLGLASTIMQTKAGVSIVIALGALLLLFFIFPGTSRTLRDPDTESEPDDAPARAQARAQAETTPEAVPAPSTGYLSPP